MGLSTFSASLSLTKANLPLRASLTTALDCDSCLLGLRITNGTEWLQIGGRDDTFLPIVTKESQVSKTTLCLSIVFWVIQISSLKYIALYLKSNISMWMARWQQHLTSAWPLPSPLSVRSDRRAAAQVSSRPNNRGGAKIANLAIKLF